MDDQGNHTNGIVDPVVQEIRKRLQQDSAKFVIDHAVCVNGQLQCGERGVKNAFEAFAQPEIAVNVVIIGCLCYIPGNLGEDADWGHFLDDFRVCWNSSMLNAAEGSLR